MDRQRNDRLGRVQQRASGLLKHRWKVLRAIRDNAYGYSRCNSHANSHADGDGHVNTSIVTYTKDHSDTEG
jgi:hypothetical protein